MRIYLFSAMLNNDHMKTIEHIHRGNLAILVKEFGGVTAVAEVVGCTPSQYSQWLNGSANSGTGKPRGMRPSSTRKIEVACKKPSGWMDVDHDEVFEVRQEAAQYGAASPVSTATPIADVAVGRTAYLMLVSQEDIELLHLFHGADEEGRDAILDSARTAPRSSFAGLGRNQP